MSRDFDLGGKVKPWGRSAAEYEAFFALANIPTSARVLDCGSGPSSFTAEWSRQGRFVVAADPIYQESADAIDADFEPTAARMLEGTRKAHDRFIWNHFKTPEDVVESRRKTLNRFLEDFLNPDRRGHYVAARLPELPFSNDTFDLVLCSHMLFLYSEELSLDLHIASLREMLRVGREVRVFPLLDMEGRRSEHLDACMRELEAIGRVGLSPVPFEFRRGDSTMFCLAKREFPTNSALI
jgi:SAM-dependent methyltransferase